MLSSRFLLVVLLLSVPMQDPLCFSAQSGLIPDPGVNAGYLSVPIRNLAGPEMFLTFVFLTVSILTLFLN